MSVFRGYLGTILKTLHRGRVGEKRDDERLLAKSPTAFEFLSFQISLIL